MTALRMLARKEVRALLPIWAACMAALVLAARLEFKYLPDIAAFIFVFGCLATGAHSMGHEYAHRTLPLLLTQPISRRQILIVKTGVLAILIAALAVAALALLAPDTNARLEMGLTPIQGVTLSALAGLFITPYLTMLCRSGLGGMVFTVGVAFTAGSLLTMYAARAFGGTVESFMDPANLRRAIPMLSAVAAIGGWRLIQRLDAGDGPRRDIHLPWLSQASSRAGSSSARHPLVWLARKELRLHQMSLVVIAIWAVVLTVLLVRGRWEPRSNEGVLVFAVMAIATLPMVIAGIASAEERQLGTHQWQQLIPVSMSTQWRVKAGVAFGLALVFGFGMPVVALDLIGSVRRVEDWAYPLLLVFALTSVGLYASSLSGTVIRAIVSTLLVAVAAPLVVQFVAVEVIRGGSAMVLPIALAAPAPVLLMLAARNHRGLEPAGRQLRRQAGWLAISAAVAIVLMA